MLILKKRNYIGGKKLNQMPEGIRQTTETGHITYTFSTDELRNLGFYSSQTLYADTDSISFVVAPNNGMSQHYYDNIYFIGKKDKKYIGGYKRLQE